MVNLPSDPELLTSNAEYVLLQTGSNPDTYTVLQDLLFHLGRPKFEYVSTASNQIPQLLRYKAYGAAEYWIEATMLLSLNEFISFSVTNLARDSNGATPILFMRVKITDKSGNPGKTMMQGASGFKCRVMSCDMSKPTMGAVKYRIRLELLEDSITIA